MFSYPITIEKKKKIKFLFFVVYKTSVLCVYALYDAFASTIACLYEILGFASL